MYSGYYCKHVRTHAHLHLIEPRDLTRDTYACLITPCRWGLLNEPRCKGSIRNMDGKTSNGGMCHPAIQAWIEEMSAEMKVSAR